MTAVQMSDRQLDRIAQMVALAQNLADRASNPNEAAAATQKVQELLFKHNLSMGAVRQRVAAASAQTSRSATDGFLNERFDIGAKTAWLSEWKKQLLYVIATNNFCRFIVVQGTTYGYLIGEEVNVITVKHLYDYLVKEIWRLCKKGWPEAAPHTRTHERSWKASYCKGAVAMINERLQQQRRDLEAANNSQTGLALLQEEALEAAYNSFHPGRRQRADTRRTDWAAFDRGNEAASRINLNRQIRG